MSKEKFNRFQCIHLNHPYQSLLLSPIKPYVYTSPNKQTYTHTLIDSTMTYPARISYTSWTGNSFRLSTDYSRFTYPHIFKYEIAESVLISLPIQLIVHVL
jgi:hypothetical protein